jgi:WD40 repeat protein
VCVWDTLLPSSKALIAAPACHPAGATAVVFSATHQLLISGGEGGSISVFDMRQRRVLHNLSSAHETAIKTLALHPSGECLLSGSASGDVKIWSLPIFREVAALGKVHSKQSFLGDAASNILGDAASNMAINVVRLTVLPDTATVNAVLIGLVHIWWMYIADEPLVGRHGLDCH